MGDSNVKTASRRLAWTAAAVVLTAGSGLSGRTDKPHDDPFAFLAPSIVVSAGDRERLDRDKVIARTLSGKGGQLAVFAATRLDADPDALVTWTRAIAELKRSTFVLAIGRLSDPPEMSDLDDLVLDDRDVDAIRRCVPGDCGLKFTRPEIESLTAVIAAAGAGWRDGAQREFKRLLIERVRLYRAGGLAAVPPLADRKTPRRLDEALSAIVAASPYLSRLPDVSAWLRQYPDVDDPRVESFFYWSQEHYGSGKPVISVTHVGIVRPGPDRRLPVVLVAGKQIFATHYINGSLGLTMVLRDATNNVPYLVYLNRSQLDVLRGVLGGFARGVLEGRLERDAPKIVRGLRTRLESGAPPHGPLDAPPQTTEGAR